MSLPLPPARRRRRRGPVLAAAAVLVTVAAAIIVIASRPPGREAPGMPIPPSTQKARRVPAGPAGTAPAGIAVSIAGWRAVRLDGSLVPVSPGAGPRERARRLAAGFADTPAGAVMAAIDIAVRTSGQLGPAIFTPTITQQVTGPGSAALLAAAQSDYAQDSAVHPPARPGGPAGKASAAARAFRLASWTPGGATVDVVTIADGADGRGVVTELQVRWLAGDWRLLAPPGGDFAAAASPAAALSGFTSFPWR